MSQPPDNSAKSKHHNLFRRLKQHLQKKKSDKGKGRAEGEPAPGPEQDDGFLLNYISAATNQQEPHHEHDCQCEVCLAIAEANNDISLKSYIQAAARGEVEPDVDCDCAVCATHRQNHPQSIEDAYFSATRHSGPIKHAYFSVPRDAEAMRAMGRNTSGHALPSSLVNNPDTGSPQPPTGHLPSILPSITRMRNNVPQAPVVAGQLNLDPQLMDTPPIPPHLLRRLASRECRHGNGGAGSLDREDPVNCTLSTYSITEKCAEKNLQAFATFPFSQSCINVLRRGLLLVRDFKGFAILIKSTLLRKLFFISVLSPTSVSKIAPLANIVGATSSGCNYRSKDKRLHSYAIAIGPSTHGCTTLAKPNPLPAQPVPTTLEENGLMSSNAADSERSAAISASYVADKRVHLIDPGSKVAPDNVRQAPHSNVAQVPWLPYAVFSPFEGAFMRPIRAAMPRKPRQGCCSWKPPRPPLADMPRNASSPETLPEQGDDLADGESFDLPLESLRATLRPLLGGKKGPLNFHGKRIHLLPSEVHEAFSRAQKARAKILHGQLATCTLSCRTAPGKKGQIDRLKERVKRLKRKIRALKRELELWKEAREHTLERGDFFRRLSKRTVEKLRDAEHEWAEAKKNGEDARKVLRVLSTVVKKYRRNVGARNVPPTPPAPHTTPVTPTTPTSPTSPVLLEPLGA
ncbi:hypothetical protein L211DRAFT_882269 [Terfezia boudieri ATCC MYA-4762]|uniref:Uncharacterized protein n=1 Tax=Terfezia boudieri ATCC MYA-4762 TaxID=1051890 RepID=A0A3N4M274_9PEZI|nr:hypothetical protein L211DRAFT_882269 [Terfezia boudieri ATCC MYA-4762]